MYKKEKVTRIFQMTADTALAFFEIVGNLKKQGYKDSPEMRTRVLNSLAKAGKMDRVYDTKRTEDEVVKGFKAQGFKIDDRRKAHDVPSSKESVWQRLLRALKIVFGN